MEKSSNIFQKLLQNSQEDFDEVKRLLIKIANGILREPNNLKVRTLQKVNPIIKGKIISKMGGADSLRLMGFIEEPTTFSFPPNRPTSQLYEVILTLEKLHYQKIEELQSTSTKTIYNEPAIEKIVLLPFKTDYPNKQFLSQIQYNFHQMLRYTNTALIQRAFQLIPIIQLEISAQQRMRYLQRQVKMHPEVVLHSHLYSFEDMLVIELLNWFKNDFFEWVDRPKCPQCGNCRPEVMAQSSSMHTDCLYAERVEVYNCLKCRKHVTFPRYNDLNILLETRRGRCGEWAQVFTLLCVALGWEVRYVVDENDHVWNEVYSVAQQRWVHCDPCENVYDMPLMYEIGWRKKHTYILAYSTVEVQDVTWRYSNRHQQLLNSRHKCSESDLVNALIYMRGKRQEALSQYHKMYLNRRLLKELIELMVERAPRDEEKVGGRVSGDLEWRINRGECNSVKEPDLELYFWPVSPINYKQITVRYSIVEDRYEFINGAQLKRVNQWIFGVFQVENIFRKEETDWNMVYLARNEHSEIGKIHWKFSLTDTNIVIDTVYIKFVTATYETGQLSITVSTDADKRIILPANRFEHVLSNSDISNAKSLVVSCILSGGTGSVAWQHAQLFRQSMMDTDNAPFIITFTFRQQS